MMKLNHFVVTVLTLLVVQFQMPFSSADDTDLVDHHKKQLKEAESYRLGSMRKEMQNHWEFVRESHQDVINALAEHSGVPTTGLSEKADHLTTAMHHYDYSRIVEPTFTKAQNEYREELAKHPNIHQARQARDDARDAERYPLRPRPPKYPPSQSHSRSSHVR